MGASRETAWRAGRKGSWCGGQRRSASSREGRFMSRRTNRVCLGFGLCFCCVRMCMEGVWGEGWAVFAVGCWPELSQLERQSRREPPVSRARRWPRAGEGATRPLLASDSARSPASSTANDHRTSRTESQPCASSFLPCSLQPSAVSPLVNETPS